MAQLWPAEISKDTIGRALKRIGFTCKKTYLDTERDPKKRQAYDTELVPFKEHQPGYLDEADINNTEDDAYGWCPKGEHFAAERRKSTIKLNASVMAAWYQQ